MRRIRGAIFLSLDGVMQAPGGPSEDPSGGFAHGGWVAPYFDEQLGAVMGELFAPPYALLLGRRTWDIFAAHWPFVTGEEAAMGEALTAADKFVLTHGDGPLDWANSYRMPHIDDVAKLKRSDGPDLLIQGSSTLYPQLLERGLIDRLTVMTFPVLLGGGKSPWGDWPGGALTLVDHKVTKPGVVVATYEPAGAVPTGSFAPTEPSAVEQDRQRRMREGSW